MNSTKSSVLVLFAVFMLALAGLAAAVEVDSRGNVTYSNDYSEDARNQGTLVDIDVIEIKVNGETVNNGDEIRYSFQRGEPLDISVKMRSFSTIKNTEIIAMINGDEHDTISDSTELFDAQPGVIYNKKLSLDLTNLMERDSYKLRIMVADRNSAIKVYNYNLQIDTARHSALISDVIFNPSNEVKAGKALLAVVRVKNMGEKTEKNVKVTVSMPELGISASDYINEIKADEQESSEELYLRVPNCATPGVYKVQVTVDFNDKYGTATKSYNMPIVTGDSCNAALPTTEERTVITIGADNQQVTPGQAGAVYPVSVTNSGSATKTYVLSIDGADQWATTKISPSNVLVVEAGSTKTAYVYVTATKDAAAGEHLFTITVQSGNEVLKQVPVKATVSNGTSTSSNVNLTKALEIALIVLVILLVIVGLILAFSRMRKEEKDETQTYY